MDPRWIVDAHEDGPVIRTELPKGKVILSRSLWVHDCLEIDLNSRSVNYREQRITSDDDPGTWAATPLTTRCVDGRWQFELDRSEWERWVREQEGVVKNCREFDARFPGVSLTDRTADAERRLNEIRAVGYGWIGFATDVSEAVAREFNRAPSHRA